MKIKFKRLHPDATLPRYAKPGDAAVDLKAIECEYDNFSKRTCFKTGLAVEIPKDHVGLLFPRSSIVVTKFALSNSVGVIDSSYRGEIKLFFNYIDSLEDEYKIGDKVGQLLVVPYPKITPIWAKELSTTERGEGGFGSSGA